MVKINDLIIKMEEENVFSNVTKKINQYKKDHPGVELLSLGIGDVSRPVVKPVIDKMHQAVDDLANMETFKGYNACYGYDFLKEKILENEYQEFKFSNDEIYISNGTKPDCTNILELFDINSRICITNAMYPVYRDGAYCLNRNVNILPVNEGNNFMPDIPKEKYDIIYICSPNNPTGVCYTYDELKKWVDYALKNDSVILYDNVYVPFIESKDVPKSIYEIEGAKKVAIEFRSFSKTASFTGVRCSYYIIPNDIHKDINKYWKKRTINRFNGTDYIAQMGAVATYEEESKLLIKENINYYKENTKRLRNFFIQKGFKVYGGIDSPYIWVRINEKIKSWEFFDLFLNKLNIIIIPGIIFGECGDNYFRVSGFAPKEVIEKAIKRMERYYQNSK